VSALTLRVQRVDPAEQTRVELSGADRVIDALAALEQPGQDLVDIAYRKCVVGAVVLDGACGTRASAFPHLLHRVALATEQDELALRPPGREHCDGLGLREARQVVKVAVLSIAERR